MMTFPWAPHYDPGVPLTVGPVTTSLPQLLLQGAEQSPQSPALVFFGRTTTYGELNTRTASLASSHRGAGHHLLAPAVAARGGTISPVPGFGVFRPDHHLRRTQYPDRQPSQLSPWGRSPPPCPSCCCKGRNNLPSPRLWCFSAGPPPTANSIPGPPA